MSVLTQPGLQTTRNQPNQINNQNRKEIARQSLALLNKIVGSAKFESGAHSDPSIPSTGLGDNSTEISNFRYGSQAGVGGFFNIAGNSLIITGARKLWNGFRAAVDVGDSDNADKNINRSGFNLKLMDYQLYIQMKRFTEIMFNEDGTPATGNEVDSLRNEIIQRVTDLISRPSMLDSSSNPEDMAEKASLLNLLKFVVNEDGNPISEYLQEITEINTETTDSQHLKVLSDAKFRFRKTFFDIAAAAASKSMAVALAPVAGFVGGVGIAAGVETASQSASKYYMEKETLEKTIANINLAVNKELAHFFVIEENLPEDRKAHPLQINAETPPIRRYGLTKNNFDQAEIYFRGIDPSVNTPEQINLITNNFVQEANNLIAISFYILNNYQTLVDRMANSGATISVASRDRWRVLRETVKDIETCLKTVKLVPGNYTTRDIIQNLSTVSSVSKSGNRIDYVLGENIQTGSSQSSEILRSNTMDMIAMEEAQRLETFRTEQLSAVRDQIARQALPKFGLNALGSAMAVVGAGFHAMRTAEALNGTHMVGVTTDSVGLEWMQLDDYTAKHATSAFGDATGLGEKFGFSGLGSAGDWLNTGAGDMFANSTVWFNKMHMGNSFLDQWHEGKKVAQAYGDVVANNGSLDMVNSTSGGQYDLVRSFDFGGNYGDAMNLPGWAGYIGSGLVSAGATLEAMKADQTNINYDRPQGLHSPDTRPTNTQEESNVTGSNGHYKPVSPYSPYPYSPYSPNKPYSPYLSYPYSPYPYSPYSPEHYSSNSNRLAEADRWSPIGSINALSHSPKLREALETNHVPDFVFKEEAGQYLNNQDQNNPFVQLTNNLFEKEKNNLPNPNCKAFVVIPAAGHAEGKNVADLLNSLLKQNINKDEFEVVLFVNTKIGKPDITTNHAKKFITDHPELKVRLVSHRWAKEEVDDRITMGKIRKVCNDLSAKLALAADLDDPVIISGDADMKDAHPEFVSTYIKRLNAPNGPYGVVGKIDWNQHENNDIFKVGLRIKQYTEAFFRKVNGKPGSLLYNKWSKYTHYVTSTNNLGYSMKAYCAVGGFDPAVSIGEDMSIGDRLKVIPNTGDSVKYGGAKTKIISDARRAIVSFNNGIPPMAQWEEWANNQDGLGEGRRNNNATLEEFKSANSYEEFRVGFEKMLNSSLFWYLKTNKWLEPNLNDTLNRQRWQDFIDLFKKITDWMGAKFMIEEDALEELYQKYKNTEAHKIDILDPSFKSVFILTDVSKTIDRIGNPVLLP